MVSPALTASKCMQQLDRIPGVTVTDVARHLRKKLPAFGNFLHAMHHPHQLAVFP